MSRVLTHPVVGHFFQGCWTIRGQDADLGTVGSWWRLRPGSRNALLVADPGLRIDWLPVAETAQLREASVYISVYIVFIHT